MATVQRGKGPVQRGKAPPPKAPARKTAPPANGHDDAAPGSFEDLMNQAIGAVPEEPELEVGEYRFKIKSVTVNAAKGRILMVLQAIEDLGGVMEGRDLAACMPAFMNFDPARAGDMRQLSEIALAAGVDAELSKTEMIEKKALNGIELIGSITKSDPAAREDGRVFINVRGLRVPE